MNFNAWVFMIGLLIAGAWVSYLLTKQIGRPPKHLLIIWRSKMASGDPVLIDQVMKEMDEWNFGVRPVRPWNNPDPNREWGGDEP